MKEKIHHNTNKNVSNATNSDRLTNITNELKDLANIKGMSILVKVNNKIVNIGAKPFNLLYILLYSLYFVFPIFLMDSHLSGMYFLLIISK